jgi:hypothetical protein
MKANAELYLRENFKADWAPIRKTNEDVAIVDKVVPAIFKKAKKVRYPTCFNLHFDCNF